MTVRIRNLAEARRKLNHNLVAPPLRRFHDRAALKVQGRATINAPDGVSGNLRRSIATEVDSAFLPLWSRVGTNLPYAEPVELGSRPHWPPKGALTLWAERKTGGKWTDYTIRRHIARFGTKPHPYLKPALDDSEADIRRYLDIAAREIEEAANSGGA